MTLKSYKSSLNPNPSIFEFGVSEVTTLNLSNLLPIDPDGAGPRINNARFVGSRLRLTEPT
ncbi:MAG: hypothetical protein WBA99_20195, partial [Nodosilinea sp.]